MMPTRFQIRQAANTIRSQGVITYPTESIYGLGCDPFSEDAVNKILHLKHRPLEKGLILIASTLEQLEVFTDLSTADRNKIYEHTSPITWLVKKSLLTPLWISGEHTKVAIRLSRHPVVKALCNEARTAIVSTSANKTNSRPATTLLQARQYFPTQLNFYLGGNTGNLTQATPIVDIETSESIRI